MSTMPEVTRRGEGGGGLLKKSQNICPYQSIYHPQMVNIVSQRVMTNKQITNYTTFKGNF